MIHITDYENKIFNYLLKVVKNRCPNIIIRVHGGWVRDKIVGIESNDIDIVTNILGTQFAQHIYQELLQDNLVTTKHSFCVIKANPKKSKHLETAAIDLFGTKIDIVNFRSEKHFQHTRIPEVYTATPLESLYRYDLTINTLYYDFKNNIVEDLTGRGLPDLHAGIFDTPSDPMQTYTDDPLRILRLFRFVAIHNFSIKDRLINAIKNQSVKEALANKISKERIGLEFRKILKNPYSHIAINYIYELNLFKYIFKIPDTHSLLESKFVEGINYFNILVKMIQHLNIDFKDTYMFLLSALLFPFQEVICNSIHKKELTISSHIVKHSLRFTNKENNILNKIINSIKICQTWSDNNYQITRKELGLFMKCHTSEYWEHVILLANIVTNNESILDPDSSYNKIKNLVIRYNFDDPLKSWQIKPLYGVRYFKNLGISKWSIIKKMLNKQYEIIFDLEDLDEIKIKCDELINNFIQHQQ